MINDDENKDSLLDDSLSLSDNDSTLNDDSSSNLLSDQEDSSLLGTSNDTDISLNENNDELNNALSIIEKKLEDNTVKLSKLDQLEDIKLELQKMNSNSIVSGGGIVRPNNSSNSPDIKEMSDKINEMEEQVSALEKLEDLYKANQSTIDNYNTIEKKITDLHESNETNLLRIANLEKIIKRFEDLEKELEVEYVEESSSHKKNNKSDKGSDDEKSNLSLLILVFVLLICAIVALDFMGYVDLYLSKTIKNLF